MVLPPLGRRWPPPATRLCAKGCHRIPRFRGRDEAPMVMVRDRHGASGNANPIQHHLKFPKSRAPRTALPARRSLRITGPAVHPAAGIGQRGAARRTWERSFVECREPARPATGVSFCVPTADALRAHPRLSTSRHRRIHRGCATESGGNAVPRGQSDFPMVAAGAPLKFSIGARRKFGPIEPFPNDRPLRPSAVHSKNRPREHTGIGARVLPYPPPLLSGARPALKMPIDAIFMP